MYLRCRLVLAVIALQAFITSGELIAFSDLENCVSVGGNATTIFQCGLIEIGVLEGSLTLADVQIVNGTNSSKTTKVLRAATTTSFLIAIFRPEYTNVSFSFDAASTEPFSGAFVWTYFTGSRDATALARLGTNVFLPQLCDPSLSSPCLDFNKIEGSEVDNHHAYSLLMVLSAIHLNPNATFSIDNIAFWGDRTEQTPTENPTASPIASPSTSQPTLKNVTGIPTTTDQPTLRPTSAEPTGEPTSSPTAGPDQTLLIAAASAGALGAVILGGAILYARRPKKPSLTVDVVEKVQLQEMSVLSLKMDVEPSEGRTATFLEEYVPKKKREGKEVVGERNASDAKPRRTYLERVRGEENVRRSLFRPSPAYLKRFGSQSASKRKSKGKFTDKINSLEDIVEGDIEDAL